MKDGERELQQVGGELQAEHVHVQGDWWESYVNIRPGQTPLNQRDHQEQVDSSTPFHKVVSKLHYSFVSSYKFRSNIQVSNIQKKIQVVRLWIKFSRTVQERRIQMSNKKTTDNLWTHIGGECRRARWRWFSSQIFECYIFSVQHEWWNWWWWWNCKSKREVLRPFSPSVGTRSPATDLASTASVKWKISWTRDWMNVSTRTKASTGSQWTTGETPPPPYKIIYHTWARSVRWWTPCNVVDISGKGGKSTSVGEIIRFSACCLKFSSTQIYVFLLVPLVECWSFSMQSLIREGFFHIHLLLTENPILKGRSYKRHSWHHK